METFLSELKDLVEGRRSLEGWEHCWNEHQQALESLLSRRLVYLLKIRPLLAAPEVLHEHRVPYRQKQFQCRPCGSLLFRAMPGETTREEIDVFAVRATFPGRERILKTHWIHPGLYCPKGCTKIIWHIPDKLTPEEALLREQERAEADERHRLEAERFKILWGERVCAQCGKRLRTWADPANGRCGYCRHPLEIPPTT